jgi:RNA polymerase sigma-70 factor (ECF subfamily)
VRTVAVPPQSPPVTTEALTPVAQGFTGAAPFDLAAVYAREFDWVWHTLRRLGVAQRNLADVTHDVFVVVHQRAHTYDPARPLRPWLFGVAYRVAKDHQSLGRNRNESVGEAVEVVDTAPAQDQRVEQSQARELVLCALQSLDLERRVVFILHDLEEQPMREIADALDVPAKTLYARLKVAREQFVAAVRRLRMQRGEQL